MQKYGALVLLMAGLPLLAQSQARGKVVSDLKITCSYKDNSGVEKIKTTIEVEKDLHRLRYQKYVAKFETELFESDDIDPVEGAKAHANFFAARGEKLVLTPVTWDAMNFKYVFELPAKAIYPSREEYSAQLKRINWREDALSKTYDLKCKTSSSVQNFQFPYLSDAVFKELPETVRWQFLGSVAETSTADLSEWLSDEGAETSAKEEEKLGRWLDTAKNIYDPAAFEALPAPVKEKVAKLQERLKKEIQEIDDLIMEENELTQEEVDEYGGGTGSLSVVTNLQGEVIGYVLSLTNTWCSDEGDDDNGWDTYFDSELNEISNQEWSP